MQKIYQDVEEKALLLHSFLHAASYKSSRAKQTKEDLMNAGTAIAAAICLRNRSKNVIAVQLIVTIILHHNWMVSDFISCIFLKGIFFVKGNGTYQLGVGLMLQTLAVIYV